MRLPCLLAASVLFACGSAWAVTPVDPFDEAVKACASADPGAVAATMATLHATPLGNDEIDQIRLGQDIGLAYAYLSSQMSQGDIDTQPKSEGSVMGWTADRVRVLVTTQVRGKEGGRLCAVVAPYDKFDEAVTLLGDQLSKGRPDKRLTFSNHRVAAWSLAFEGPIPRILVMGADFGGDRKPTSVQIVTK